MTLFPATLLGRNVLLLIGLILLGQLFAGLVYRQGVQKPIVEHFASVIAANILSMDSVLRAIPVELRAGAVATFNERQEVRQSSHSAGVGNLFAKQMFMTRVSTVLEDSGLDITWKTDANGSIYAELKIENQPYQLSTFTSGLGANLPYAAVYSWLLGLLLAVLGALAIQRVINRPLMRLTEASRAIGQGETHQPLEESGPGEIAEVCRSFNQMQLQLAEQESNRALMLAGVSHDLRTPLTKIRIAAELLGAQENNEFIDSIVRSCRQSERIVQQFVDFAGVDSREPCSLCNVNQLVANLVQYSSVSFHIRSTDIPDVWVRPRGLERALWNLMENAQRYGAPDFVIATGLSNGRVFIDVIDHGPGIPVERREEMLKPFTRGNAARSGPPGAGLGLSIAQRLLTLDGGSLTIINRPDCGLCMRLLLKVSSR